MVPSRLFTATFGASDPARVARFWGDLLGRKIVEDARGWLVPGDDSQLDLRFAPSRAEKAGPNRMHVHLTSTTWDHQRDTVAAALSLGAMHVDVGQRDEEEHIVLADPERNEFCVLEPENAYSGISTPITGQAPATLPWTLADCGFLGELACDGTRDVGLFWSRVLDWPLVWDRDEETAIQSPPGGTKVSWGGSPVSPTATSNRQHFDVVLLGGDSEAEVERLIALGATHVDRQEDGSLALADPDGLRFCLLTQ